MKTRTDILSAIQDRIEQVEQTLSASTGERSLCQVHKDGTVTGGIKYDEGRYTALRRIRRFVKSNPELDIPATLFESLQQEAEDWRKMLQTYQHKVEPPIQWIAYARGGLDAVEDLLATLFDF